MLEKHFYLEIPKKQTPFVLLCTEVVFYKTWKLLNALVILQWALQIFVFRKNKLSMWNSYKKIVEGCFLKYEFDKYVNKKRAMDGKKRNKRWRAVFTVNLILYEQQPPSSKLKIHVIDNPPGVGKKRDNSKLKKYDRKQKKIYKISKIMLQLFSLNPIKIDSGGSPVEPLWTNVRHSAVELNTIALTVG